MRTIKAFCAALAVGAISACLAVSVSASEEALTGTYDADTNKVAVEYTTASGKEYTVVIVKESVWTDIESGRELLVDDLLYLDQFDGGEDTLSGMGVKTPLTMDQVDGKDVATTYKVLIGAEDMSSIAEFDVVIAPEEEEPPVEPPVDPKPEERIFIGDVNLNGEKPDANDLADLALYVAGVGELKSLIAGDVNNSGDVPDANDLADLTLYIAGVLEFKAGDVVITYVDEWPAK